MKRTSWRAALKPGGGASSLSGARLRPRPTVGASARPDDHLKPAAQTGDPTGVPLPRTPAAPAAPELAPPLATAVAAAPPATRRRSPGRPRRRARRLLALLPVVAAATVLAGCFSIVGQSTVQEGDIGDVIVTTDMCLLGASDTGATCSAGLSDTVDGNIQYLMAYLVPTWAIEPPAIAFNGNAGNLSLSRDVAYESAMQGFAPAPLGLRWVGYASGEQPAPPVETDWRQQAIARVGVPDTAPATMRLATVSAWRVVRDNNGGKRTALSITRAYNCEEVTDGVPTTRCVLSGSPSQGTSPGMTPSTDEFAINTLSLGAPAPINAVRAGGTAVLKFPIATNYRGEGNDTIPMKVTTTLKGAKIEAPPNVILGQAISPAEVRITVPLIAETGDYTVTLGTANGLRQASGTIRVVGIRSLIAPSVGGSAANLKETIALLRTYLKTAKSSQIRRGNIFDLPVTLPAAGTLTASLTGKGTKKVLSTGDAKSRIPGAVNLAMKPTAAGKRLLKKSKPLSGRLSLTWKPRSGKTQRGALTVTLK